MNAAKFSDQATGAADVRAVQHGVGDPCSQKNQPDTFGEFGRVDMNPSSAQDELALQSLTFDQPDVDIDHAIA